MLPSYQDRIIAGLARKGYMVGAASKDGVVASVVDEDHPSTLFALSIYQMTETTVDQIYKDVISVLSEMKAYSYSVVVALSAESTWSGPNFKLPSKADPIPTPTDKNMN